jgi:Geminivirus coat protein/nuclear export factor BR1 family.
VNDLKNYIEHHFVDNYPSRNFTTVGNTDNVTKVAEGDTSLTRTGLKITPTSLYLRGIIKVGAIGTPPVQDPIGGLVRMMIVRDKQQIGDTVPAMSDVVETAPLRVIAPLSRLNRARFEVLWDTVFKINPNSSNSVIHFKKYLKLSSKRSVYYNGGANTDIQKNGLYIMMCCDDAVYSPSISYYYRLRFADC